MFEEDGESANKVTGSAGENSPETTRASGPLSIVFPPDRAVWNEARRLVAENVRVEDLALCAAQDPVLTIELIKKANAMFFAGARSPITTAKAAIVRLGSVVVLEVLEKLKERTGFEDEDVTHWFEIHRSRCKRTSIVAALLSETLSRNLTEDCQTAALFFATGELLAVAHFKEVYVKLAEEHSRSGVNYRLASDHKFDVEKIGLNYLRRAGIPEALLFALDRDATSRAPDRAVMRPIVQSAVELVEAFDANRWEKVAPGKALPAKSSLRLLKITDAQYLKVYERASEYLFSSRLLEEKRKQESVLAPKDQDGPRVAVSMTSDQQALDSEINNLLFGGGAAAEETESEAEGIDIGSKVFETSIAHREEQMKDPSTDQFSLTRDKPAKTVPRVEKKARRQKRAAPELRTSKGTKAVSNINAMLQTRATSEELLSDLLSMLVDNGPFEKSALIVISKDRKNAIVVAARGPSIGNGQKLQLDDPLSPLAQCFSKVQSFGNKKSPVSPFGSKSFAVAPIDADHETPVALYADCGNEGSISFEARRVFRTVVELLNERLPQVPGGIPVELINS